MQFRLTLGCLFLTFNLTIATDIYNNVNETRQIFSQKDYPSREPYLDPFYVVEGSAILFSNLLIIVAFFSSKSLRRKELAFVAGLAVCDGLNGLYYCRNIYFRRTLISQITGFGKFGGSFSQFEPILQLLTYLSAGIFRLRVYYGPPVEAPLHWDCAWTVHAIAALFGTELGQPAFQLAIAVDRFLAVNYFYWYRSSPKAYIPVVLGVITAFLFGYWAKALYTSYHMDSYDFPMCWATSWGPNPRAFRWYFSYSANFLACCLYLYTVLQQRRKFASIAPQYRESYKYQIALNRMFTMIFVFTTILYLFPWTVFILADNKMGNVSFLASWWTPNSYGLVMTVFMLQALNSLVTVGLYLWRSGEFRKAIKDMFTYRRNETSSQVQPLSSIK